MNNMGNATLSASSPLPEDFSCTLSPHAHALSSVLTAFVSSIVGGISGGFELAYFTALVSWFAVLRIIIVAIYQVCCAVCLVPIEGGSQFCNFLPVPTKVMKGFKNPLLMMGEDSSDPTWFGWLGWLYTTCYAPTIQVMWLVENWSKAGIGLKFVRVIGVSVAALPSTLDTKARYGKALGESWGRHCDILFTFMTAASTVVLGGVAATELVLIVMDGLPWWFAATYLVFALFWTHISFKFQSPTDGGNAVDSIPTLLGGLATGVLGGALTAVPAFILMYTAAETPGIGLNNYLHCRTVELWQKAVAVLP